MKKLLMVCIEFPPIRTTGQFRSAGFAKHLPAYGIEPIVLSCELDSGKATFGKSSDPSLLDNLPNDLKIFRLSIKPFNKIWKTKLGDFLRIWWNTTDKIHHRWLTSSNKLEVDQIICEEKPDAIYVSLPPFSMAYSAIYLSKKYKLPLIVDMRDAWSLWGTSPFKTRFHYYKVKRLEKKLFKHANLIIGVTDELVNDFKDQHPEIRADKFKTVYNGYDSFSNESVDIKGFDQDFFHVGYVGSFYYNPEAEELQNIKWWKRKGRRMFYYWPRKEYWLYRSPYFFLKAMREYNDNLSTSNKKIVFHHVGNTPDWLINMVEKNGLKNVFEQHGFVTKKEALNLQNKFDALLATSEKIEGGKHFCLPSKTFDYINSGKPILAFLTEGTQKEIFLNVGQAIIFKPEEVQRNARILSRICNNPSVTNKTESNFIENYTRAHQTKKIIKHLKKMTEISDIHID